MTESKTSQAVAQREEGPGAMVAKYRTDFATVLPSHVNADQWVRVAQGIMRRNPTLAKVAQKNPGSFLSAMLDCARLGLEPGDTYHLVPFGNEVVGIPDYTGEIELMYRAGEVVSVTAEVVRANDTFEWVPGEMERPHHRVDWFAADRGELVGAYAYATMRSGATSRVVVMSRADIEKVKAVSKTASRSDSPWKQWEDRMWLKTVCHQLRKWVPTSAEYRQEVLRQQTALEHLQPDLRDSFDQHGTNDWDEITDAEVVEDDDVPAGQGELVEQP